MSLIVVLAALALLQIWDAGNPLQRDQWFTHLMKRAASVRIFKSPWYPLLFSVFLPSLFLAAVLSWLPVYLVYPIALLTFLYALGRGEFAGYLDSYKNACGEGAWEDGVIAAQREGVNIAGLEQDDWSTLNARVLEKVAYQGFERLFCVLFWFVFFGPAGALLYRLSYLYQQDTENPVSSRWLWVLEWPAVRLLSVSFAITGNFVGCVNRWKDHVFCTEISSQRMLKETALGALSVDDDMVHTCDCTQREVAALRRLLTRTLWFWVAALAIWTLF